MFTIYQVRKKSSQIELLREILKIIHEQSSQQLPLTYSISVHGLLHQVHEALEEVKSSSLDLDQLLKNLVACAFNLHGNVDEGRGTLIATTCARLQARAYDDLANGDFNSCYHIIRAVLVAYLPVSGMFRVAVRNTGIQTESTGMLERVGEQLADEPLRAQIFKDVSEMYEGCLSLNWPVSLAFLTVMAKFVDNAEQEIYFLECCDKYRTPYSDESLQLLLGNEVLQPKLMMYERRNSPAALQEFIEANLDDDSMRQYAVERAIKHQQYAEALKWCREVVDDLNRSDERRSPYTFYKLMLQAAEGSGDHSSCYDAALWLFQYGKEFDYYMQLKSYANPVTWREIYPDVIKPVMFAAYASTLVQVFIEEKDWVNLLTALPHLHAREWIKFEGLLFESCPQLLKENYQLMVTEQLKCHDARTAEEQIVIFLTLMISRFGVSHVATNMSIIKAMYPRRRRLHEGLAGIFETEAV